LSYLFLTGGKVASTLRSRKDSLLYAPMANVGRVTMDRDGLYIELKNINYTKKSQLYLADQQATGLGRQLAAADGHDVGYRERSTQAQQDGLTPVEILRSMQDVKVGVDQQLRKARGEKSGQSLSLFAGGAESAYNEHDEYDDGQESEDDASDAEGSDDDDHSGDTSDEGSEGGSEEGSDAEGDEYDNEYDDQYDSGEENEDGEGQSEEDDSKSSDEENAENHWDMKVQGAIRGANGALGKPAHASGGGKHSTALGGPESSGVVRGAERMATGAADLMRAVYGNNWAAGVVKDATGTEGGKNKHHDEDDDSGDELFALPGQAGAGAVSGQQQKKAAQQAQYVLDNNLDSSRVWTGVSDDVSGLVFGEHKGSVSTNTGALNEHATLLDHLRYLEKTTTAQAGGNKSAANKGVVTSAPLPAQATSSLPAESSETWWQLMKARCVTGGYANKITAAGDGEAGESGGAGSDDEGFGEFEDLQTGEKFGAKASKGECMSVDSGGRLPVRGLFIAAIVVLLVMEWQAKPIVLPC
jgi:hypothetical protein